MTKQQKARAHLARAQELLKEQYKDNLGFGTNTNNIELLPRDELSMVMTHLNNSSVRKASIVSQQFNESANDVLRKRLQTLQGLATDDQNLINAIQDGDDDMAHKLLKHRTCGPKIDEAAIQNNHHVHVIQQVLIGALESKREIKLKLPELDSTDASPFNMTINDWNKIGSVLYFSAISNENSTRELYRGRKRELQPYIPKAKDLHFYIERWGSGMIMYDLHLGRFDEDHFFRLRGVSGVLELGAKNTG